METMRGGKAVIIAGIALVFFVVAGWFVWQLFSAGGSKRNIGAEVAPPVLLPSRDDANSFKKTAKYKDDQTGLSLEYPIGWTVDDRSSFASDGVVREVAFFDESRESSGQSPKHPLNGFVGLKIYPASGPLEGLSCDVSGEETACISKREVISGESALVNTFEVSEGMDAGGKDREIIFVKNGNVFVLFSGAGSIPQSESLLTLADKKFVIDDVADSVRFAN